MATYLHPGVYVEELPSGSKPIEAVGTSVAAFIGYTQKGPVTDPTLISTWDEYEKSFGGLVETKDTETGLQDPMGHAVYAFFQNGGTKAYIVRIASDTGTAPLQTSTGISTVPGDASKVVLTFTATNPGVWGDALVVHISPKFLPSNNSAPTLFTVEIGTGKGTDFEPLERITDISLKQSSDMENLSDSVDDGSKLVTVTVDDAAAAFAGLLAAVGTKNAPASPSYVEVTFSGGGNGAFPTVTEFQAAFKKLVKVRDVNILLLPGQYWGADATKTGVKALTEAIAHCELMRSRMVLVDPPPNNELESEANIDDLSLPTQTYCVLYYPWAKVANPFYDADSNPGAERTVLVGPSAFGAGMWARIDSRRGVWKAPAGVETALLGVAGLEYTIEDAEQDFLNPLGVNAIRKLPSYGTVLWGARTLSTKANPEWRYVPVRRTAIFIEQSIYYGIQWAVFEPNDHRLWASLRANIESFMSGLFRSGAFQGEKASDAFFVRCGLGSTMTQDDIDRGQVIVLIGFAPLKPAEFVIVRIQQSVGQQ